MIKKLLKNKKTLIFIESHSVLSTLIIKKSFYKKKNKIYKYDGLWSSSLSDSLIQGIPDNEILGLNERIKNLSSIRSITNLPIIIDFDTGRNPKYFSYYVNIAQKSNIDAVVIEDKIGIKQNSLLGIKNKQKIEDIESYSNKIYEGKKSVYKKDFLIIARMEGLILGKSIDETLNRSYKSIKAGADAILIHSILNTPKEIIDFSKLHKKKYPNIPLICIPTTYNKIKFNKLKEIGINIIIYANHIVRSSFKAIEKISKDILKYQRTYEIENKCASISKILKITSRK